MIDWPNFNIVSQGIERLEEREKHGGIENCLLVEQSECTQHLLIVCHFLWL